MLWCVLDFPLAIGSSMRTTFALALLLPFCSCLNPTVRGYAAFMNLSPEGDAALEDEAGTRNVNGTRGDLEDEFNLGSGNTAYVRVDYEMKQWNVELSGFQYKDSGRSALNSPYGDIPAGTAVDTELRVSNAKLGVLRDVVNVGPFMLSGGMAFSYFDVDMDVESLVPLAAPNTVYEESNFQAPVPMLCVRGSMEAKSVRSEVSIAWIEADIADVQGLFFDVDAMVVYTPIPAFDIFAGYRYINLDVDGKLDGQQFTTHVELSGWYVGAGITF